MIGAGARADEGPIMAVEPPRRRLVARPSTRLGKTALRVAVPSIGLLAIVAAIGITGRGTPWLVVPGLLIVAGVIVAGVAAVVAIATHGERSMVAVVLALVGLFAIAFVVGELVFSE